MRLSRAHHANVSFAKTNVDADLRRHDEVDGHQVRALSIVVPPQAPHVSARNNIIQAFDVPARNAVIPVKAGIHARFNARALETLSYPHRACLTAASAPSSPQGCHRRQAKRRP